MRQKLLDYIEKITKLIAKNYTFDIFNEDDIRQEIYLIVLDVEGKYNSSKGDEFSYYYNSSKSRLKNLQRNKHINQNNKHAKDKAKVLGATQVRDDSMAGNYSELNLIEFFDEYHILIDKKIPAKFRADYLKMMEGIEIPYHNKICLYDHIKLIIESNKND